MTESSVIDFEDPAPRRAAPTELVLDLDGYEGPIDILLALARDQKVDLARISIRQLADQYLAFIQRARQVRLELAADYLVMAAWLAYLKSRLLLPTQDDETEPTGEELAEALAFQLRRLEAMREAGQRLMARDLLGRDVFPPGASDGITVIKKPVFAVSLYDLLKAYTDQSQRVRAEGFTIPPSELFSIDAAVARLSDMLGQAVQWTTLESFLPQGLVGVLLNRSAVAATFSASLELAREGKLSLRQAGHYAPIYVKAAMEETE